MTPDDEADAFFERLAPLGQFEDAVDASKYAPAPSSWVVIITDVVDSTKAIREGRYKEVNVLGAASIACVVNSYGAPRPPYVFGGDGAVLLIPRSRLPRVGPALNRLAWLAREAFGLRMRAGAVPVSELMERGLEVRVAKYALSVDVKLAMFAGAGIDEATHLVKDPVSEARYTLVDESRPPSTKAPVRGLNCRWQPFDSRNGEIVALIVKASSRDTKAQAVVYREALAFMSALFEGASVKPVSPEAAALAKTAALATEATLKTGHSGGLRHRLRRFLLGLLNRIGGFLIRHKKQIGSFNGASYPSAMVANSDFRKFDGALRMVLDATVAQREQLQAFLEERYQAKELVYGLSSSAQALMTCLVYDRGHDHVHFIDGADGGYTAAAKQLLERQLLQRGGRPITSDGDS